MIDALTMDLSDPTNWDFRKYIHTDPSKKTFAKIIEKHKAELNACVFWEYARECRALVAAVEDFRHFIRDEGAFLYFKTGRPSGEKLFSVCHFLAGNELEIAHDEDQLEIDDTGSGDRRINVFFAGVSRRIHDIRAIVREDIDWRVLLRPEFPNTPWLSAGIPESMSLLGGNLAGRESVTVTVRLHRLPLKKLTAEFKKFITPRSSSPNDQLGVNGDRDAPLQYLFWLALLRIHSSQIADADLKAMELFEFYGNNSMYLGDLDKRFKDACRVYDALFPGQEPPISLDRLNAKRAGL